MKALYRRLLQRCRTLNEVNRLHVGLENKITPLEAESVAQAVPDIRFLAIRQRAARLRDRLARRFGKTRQPARVSSLRRVMVARSCVAKLDSRILMSGKTDLEPFERRRLPHGIRLYTTGGDRTRKTLLVGYAGNARRLMMPLPVFLQHLDATHVDFVLFTCPKGEGYRSGVARIANTLPDSIRAMPGLLQMDKYDSVVSFGSSGGGIPAVMTALQLGLDAVVSTGGNNPEDPRWRNFNGMGLINTIRNYRSMPEDLPDIYLVFGADSPRDRRSAESLAKLIPAHLIPVHKPDEKVEHNALFPLVQQGKFGALLNDTIFKERETELIARPAGERAQPENNSSAMA